MALLNWKKIELVIWIVIATLFALNIRIATTGIPSEEPKPAVIQAATEEAKENRANKIYDIYANGFYIDVHPDLQWMVHDFCEEYGFHEKYVFGMILTESTFKPDALNGRYVGLCQIDEYWKAAPTIPHFTDNPSQRNLKDPYDNLLTLAELWCYARDLYDLDLMTEDGMMKICYWHNTGKDPTFITHSYYFDKCRAFANELIPL